MNFARLNHILIPDTKAGRDRLRKTIVGRLLERFFEIYLCLTREGKVLILLWMFAGLLGLEVRTRPTYLIWCVLTGVLVASLLIRRSFRLDGVNFFVEHPRIVSVDEETNFSIELSNEGNREHLEMRISGPLLPWDGHYLSERATVHQLKRGSIEQAVIRARFAARGEHDLDAFVARALVPFSISAGPPLTSTGSSLTVVPKVAPILTLRTPQTQRYQPGGVVLASQTGESMEIVGIRPYNSGDPLRDIHPLRWARLGFPVVREYQQEYFTRLGVVIDTDTDGIDERSFEAALSLAAGVIAHLSRGEALIDLLVVGSELHQMTVGRSLGHLEQALKLLGCVEGGPSFDPSSLSKRLAPYLGQLSSVVFITLRWDEPRQQFISTIRRSAVGCRVLWVAHDDEISEQAESAEKDLSRVPPSAIEASEVLYL